MKTKLNFRSVVFKRAYRIKKETGCMFSAALKQAWQRYRDYKNKVVEELSRNINQFDYHYYRSDDGRVYRKWSELKNEISQQIKSLPGSFILAISADLKNKNYIRAFI